MPLRSITVGLLKREDAEEHSPRAAFDWRKAGTDATGFAAVQLCSATALLSKLFWLVLIKTVGAWKGPTWERKEQLPQQQLSRQARGRLEVRRFVRTDPR